MKHLKRIFESNTKNYVFKGTTIDITYCSGLLTEDERKIIMKKAGGQNTYCKWYPCDGYFKPISEVKDISNIVYYEESDKDNPNAYVYEIGDEPISDWLLKEGFTPQDEIVFLVWW